MTETYTFDENTISDLHKDAYGFRPGKEFWWRWGRASDCQKQAIWDQLCDTLRLTVAREREEQARSAAQFEHLIADLIRCGAQDYDMAIRWLHEAYDTDGDDDYLGYRLGLSYGYIRRARIAAEDAVTV